MSAPCKLVFLGALAAFAAASPLMSQSRSDAKEILSRVSRTYKGLASFQLEAKSIVDVKGERGESRIESLISLAAVKPGRIRMEIKGPLMDMTFVCNNTFTWEYMPKSNTYTKNPSTLAKIASRGIDNVERMHDKWQYVRILAAGLGMSLPTYEGIDRQLRSPRIRGEEPIELNGATINCFVVEGDYDDPGVDQGIRSSPRTYWIDQDRYLVLREQHPIKIKSDSLDRISTTNFTLAEINGPLPEALFTFTPPEGARESEDSTSTRESKKKRPN